MFELGRINEQQKEAILNTEGPMLIIAGPGTGKTLTLVKRIAYLVAQRRMDDISRNSIGGQYATSFK